MDEKQQIYRSRLRSALLLLATHGSGAGMAPPETIKSMSRRMEDGKVEEGEWFALECQGGTLIEAAKELWASLPDEKKRAWLAQNPN
jgi:hypothetical protein